MTCSMVRTGKEVRYQTDYILGTDRCLFRDVTVWDPRHNSYHYLFIGCLSIYPPREHYDYLRRRKRPPLLPPTTQMSEGKLFAAQRRAVPKPKARGARKNAWISAAM